MIDQVDVHGMVLEQVINEVEIIYSSNLGLVGLTVLEHVVCAYHEASIVGESEQGTMTSH